MLDLIQNGQIIYSPDTTAPFEFDTNATYSCNDGFFLEGSEQSVCDGDGSSVNGQWDASPPRCTRKLSILRSTLLVAIIFLA